MSTCGKAKYTIMIGCVSRVDVVAPCDATQWHFFCIIMIKKKKKKLLGALSLSMSLGFLQTFTKLEAQVELRA